MWQVAPNQHRAPEWHENRIPAFGAASQVIGPHGNAVPERASHAARMYGQAASVRGQPPTKTMPVESPATLPAANPCGLTRPQASETPRDGGRSRSSQNEPAAGESTPKQHAIPTKRCDSNVQSSSATRPDPELALAHPSRSIIGGRVAHRVTPVAGIEGLVGSTGVR